MSEADEKETLTLSLSRYVFRKLERCAAAAHVELDIVVEAALEDYLAAIERCDPDVRNVVRTLVPLPLEKP